MRNSEKSRLLVLSALFAAAIAVTTAYILHIPIPMTSGYVHVGDALIYLAASVLPLPWAMAAGAVGGALADLLTAPAWAPATFVVKAVICLPFTSRERKIFCLRNAGAMAVAGVVSPTLYAFVNVFMTGSWAGFWPQFFGTLIQGVGSALVFTVLAMGADEAGLKRQLSRER